MALGRTAVAAAQTAPAQSPYSVGPGQGHAHSIVASPRPNNAVNLDPATFTEGGLPEGDMDVADLEFCFFDYGGKGPQTPALGIDFVDAQGKHHEQYYSAGEDWQPSPDGNWLIPTGSKATMAKTSNCGLFLNSLKMADQSGMMADMINAGIKNLTGTNITIVQQAQPKRAGLIRTGPNANAIPGQPDREKTIALVAKINRYPSHFGAISNPDPRPGPGPNPTPAPPLNLGGSGSNVAKPNGVGALNPHPESGVEAGALDALCTDTLITILAMNNGTVAKKDLPGLVIRTLATNPQKAQALQRIYSDEFLSSAVGVAFDGATVRLQ